MRRLSALLFLMTLGSASLSAQGSDTIRVCTYVLLEFDADSHDRVDMFRTILNEIRPHILVVQEIMSYEGFELFRDSVTKRLDIPLMGFTSQDPTPQNAIFYDTTLFGFSRWMSYDDWPRSIVVTTLYHKGGGRRGDSLCILNVDWNEGQGFGDDDVREGNGQSVEDLIQMINYRLPNRDPIDNILLAGNLNVERSSEDGYETVTLAKHHRLVDPLNRPGDWHDNADFADIHTQSTRDGTFGIEVSDGLDDRYDQILLSEPLMNRLYVPGSYTTFGNDGHHFNDSITAPPNFSVSLETAQALHDVSDHLPVFLDLAFPKLATDSPVEEKPTESDVDEKSE